MKEKNYYMKTNKVIQGDCLEVMKELHDNSVDTIITDPPYGLSFMGKKWDYDVPKEEVWKEALRVLKPGGTMLTFAGSRTYHRMAVRVEDAGFILKDCIMWLYGSGFPKATDISKQLDKGHEREIVVNPRWKDKYPNGPGGNKDSKFSQCKRIVGNPLNTSLPATPKAKLWNGWKSHGLKPAYEPIIVAMKPNDGSYAQNALKHGVSGLNIDGGRIGTKPRKTGTKPTSKEATGSGNTLMGSSKNRQAEYDNEDKGRFPANIILGEHTAKNAGEWSRYFYCAKSSKAERNEGCEEMEEKGMGRNQSSLDGGKMLTGSGNERSNKKQNNHPTVKPLKLMEYLCTLTKTPTGGIVLDPFCGSGSTLIAAKRTGREYIGIDMEEEYCKIAEARLKAVKVQGKLL